MTALRNYHALLERVTLLTSKVWEEFSPHICCRPGCDGCCRHISLFPVEGVALAMAVQDLPPDEAFRIRQAASASTGEPCPLLDNGLCLLYSARPIICRTHGLPLLTLRNGERFIDFCPRNFQHLASLPGRAVIDLDQLNTTLTAINALFVAEYFKGSPPAKERLTIAEALLTAL